ncbi:MAG: hypothetical protein ACR2OH_05760, partial [Microthrixaceae bacterium]
VLSGAELDTILRRGLTAAAVFVGFHLVATVFAVVGGRESLDSDLDLWLWVGTGLIAVTAGFRFYGHYWLQIVPPLALLAALELGTRSTRIRTLAAGVVGATAIVAFVAAWNPSEIRVLRNPEPLASAVERLTDEDDTVLVWGNFPEVYWMAQRAPAAGFVSMDFVTGRTGARVNGPHTVTEAPDRGYPHLLAEMEASPPAVVIDTQPSGFRGYGHYPIALFPELDEFIDTHYSAPTLIDGFDVYRLTTGQG